MTPDPQLQQAYLTTGYRVQLATGPVTIRVGQRLPALDQLLQQYGCRSWAFLTAYNPGSVRLAEADNQRRQQSLKQEVADVGWPCFVGAGVADDAGWPAEPSLLILGIEQQTALALAEKYGQWAIVCGTAGEPPQLLWTSLPDVGRLS